ncbi:ISAs1 family transposase [Azospirillum sp. B510]|uniref:ISAs1 family transposase n=1 Tax=Azospirillum sp. (strain B510) TaxID=137722 RepID=UPI0002F81DED|nr:ISAs1 family transposase [Azospirillum sp. B510]
MSSIEAGFGEKSRLKALLEHFSRIDDPRAPWRVAYPLPEILLLAVCGTIADCEDYEAIAAWGEARLDFLRRFQPYHHGVPSGRWLTVFMNRIPSGLFQDCFLSWVREAWPDRPELVAIDGKTSRRSHDRVLGQAPLHLVSAFATTSRLVLGQEAVEDKASELAAIPVLLERLATEGGLKGAIVTIDAIACNATIAQAVRDAGADYLLAVKANQPTLRDEIESFFTSAPPETLDHAADIDKLAQRPRPPEHGRRPPLRHQPRPQGRRTRPAALRITARHQKAGRHSQTHQHQAPQEAGRLGHRLPQRYPRR